MRSALPKVLHPIGNAPMLHHAMRAAEALAPAGERPDPGASVMFKGEDGKEIVLIAEKLGSIDAGSPIYFQGITGGISKRFIHIGQ